MTENSGLGVNAPANAAPGDSDAAQALEREVVEAIALCDGDVRVALRAALVANTFLTADVQRLTHAVSFGFTRGRTVARRASEKLDEWREISSGEHDAT